MSAPVDRSSWLRQRGGGRPSAIGNVHANDPADLFASAHRMYRDGSVGQLPREVEARHKFQIGPGADHRSTDLLIDTPGEAADLTSLIPITPLSRLSLVDNPLPTAELANLATELATDPSNHRLVQHAGGPYLVFNRRRSHVTLLHPAELPTLLRQLPAATA